MKHTQIIYLVAVFAIMLGACQSEKAKKHSEWEVGFDSLYMRIGKDTTAELKFQSIRQILKSDNLSDSTASHAYHLLGILYLATSDYDEAERNMRKSLTFLPENEPSENRARNLHALGITALQRNQLYLANYYISQAAELVIQNNYRIKYPKPSSVIIGIASNLNRYNKSFSNALRYAKAYPDFYENGISYKINAVNNYLLMAGDLLFTFLSKPRFFELLLTTSCFIERQFETGF